MAKPYVIAIATAIAAAVVGFIHGSPLLYAVVGFALVVTVANQRRIGELTDELADLRSTLPPQPQSVAADIRQVQPSERTQPAEGETDEPAAAAGQVSGWKHRTG